MMTSRSARERAEFLTGGCDHVETIAELTRRLEQKRPLRVKLGLDPTSPDLHIGHAVVLRLLQRFVEDDHDVTLLIGDSTARIGDPSGRNSLRPPLSGDQIEANMKTYAEQAGKVLDMERITLRYNSEWLGPLSYVDMIKLMSQTTVARMLERNDFRQRYESGTPIALHEFLYPVAQAYDSIALHSDVELGGSDQLFNLLMARPYQQHAGQEPEICITVPLLVGLDGEKKMSKSLGNHIGLTEAPGDMFGKTMRIPDEALSEYARLAAAWSGERVRALEAGLRDGSASPMDEKKHIAQDVVALYHGRDAALAARENFELSVQQRKLPKEILRTYPWAGENTVLDVVVAVYAVSKRQAKTWITEGAIKIDEEKVTDPNVAWPTDRDHAVSRANKNHVVVNAP